MVARPAVVGVALGARAALSPPNRNAVMWLRCLVRSRRVPSRPRWAS